jgi:hypothetical protein
MKKQKMQKGINCLINDEEIEVFKGALERYFGELKHKEDRQQLCQDLNAIMGMGRREDTKNLLSFYECCAMLCRYMLDSFDNPELQQKLIDITMEKIEKI